MQNTPFSPVTTKTNIYALLSPINGGLAFLSNCISVLAVVIPPTSFVCGAISGLFSLGALATGSVGLVQIKRAGNLQKGKGLAILGIILGVLGLIASCLIPLLGTTLLAALGLQIGDMLLVPVK